jgi:hypothetical protein
MSLPTGGGDSSSRNATLRSPTPTDDTKRLLEGQWHQVGFMSQDPVLRGRLTELVIDAALIVDSAQEGRGAVARRVGPQRAWVEIVLGCPRRAD